MNPTIHLTILVGTDGGFVINEQVPTDEFGGAFEQRLVFGGNHEEASKYISKRMQTMLGEQPKEEPKKIEAIRGAALRPRALQADPVEEMAIGE